jgi:hypothetical protein
LNPVFKNHCTDNSSFAGLLKMLRIMAVRKDPGSGRISHLISKSGKVLRNYEVRKQLPLFTGGSERSHAEAPGHQIQVLHELFAHEVA